MREHLIWLDKNWKNRGYANNLHLYVDHKEKTYDLVVSYSNTSHAIRVVAKADIEDYIRELINGGYVQSKDCCAVN